MHPQGYEEMKWNLREILDLGDLMKWSFHMVYIYLT